MSSPSISVVVPVYNAAQYVEESIDSILCQTWPDFELILVDDGSTDDSLQILRQYATRDSRVRIISRDNTGIVGALNDGLAAAEGKFIARMDADDISFPKRFADQIEYLRSHEECVAVGSAILQVDSDGRPLYAARWACEPAEIRQQLLQGHGGLAHPAAMIRAESLQAVGGYRREYELAEDKDLWFRLDEVGELANLPQALLAYRRHAKAICCQFESQVRRALLGAMEDAYQRRGIEKPVALKELHNRADPIQRELTRWIRGAAKQGCFDTASRYVRKLVEDYPRSPRTWGALAQYVLRFARHQVNRQFFSSGNAQQADLFEEALKQYTEALYAMARWSEESYSQGLLEAG